MTSFLKWPKKQTSVLSNQEEELLEQLEANKELNVLDPQPGTPPTARNKRSHSLYAMFQSSGAKDKPEVTGDAPTPQRHSLVDTKTNQTESELETPSLLKPQQKNAPHDKKGNKFLEGTNKWIDATKRRLSTAASVIPRRGSTANNASAVESDRYVGESVHTSAGAGVVVEVKQDGSAVVRLSTTEYVNISMVIIEHGGEIESLPALPKDTVITSEGVGTVVSYNPKLREYTVEILDKSIHTCSPDQLHLMEKAGDSSTESEASSSPEPSQANASANANANAQAASSESTPAAPTLRSSFLQKMAKATPKFPQLLKSRSLGNNSVKYQSGQAVLTHFGDGVVVEVQPGSPNTRPVVVVQLSFGGTAFLQVDAIKQHIKATVGDAVQTRFGPGVVHSVVEENVFVVIVDGEEMYVHASEVQKIAAPSKGFLHMFKK